MAKRSLIIATVSVVAAMPALAWGSTGHRIVCEIAWQHMSADTKREVRRIISVGNDGEFREACLWMDRARDDPRYRHLGPLHYMRFPKGSALDDIQAECSADGCARSAIEEQRDILGSSTDPEQRLLALRILGHVVGDIHQPLHCGYGADAGGNGFKVAFFGQDTVKYGNNQKAVNLHKVWDSMIIGRTRLEWQEYAVELDRSIDSTDVSLWAVDDVDRWIREAYQLVETTVYDVPEDRDLRGSYYTRSLSVIDTQLKKGGIRLALVLNATLSGDGTGAPN